MKNTVVKEMKTMNSMVVEGMNMTNNTFTTNNNNNGGMNMMKKYNSNIENLTGGNYPAIFAEVILAEISEESRKVLETFYGLEGDSKKSANYLTLGHRLGIEEPKKAYDTALMEFKRRRMIDLLLDSEDFSEEEALSLGYLGSVVTNESNIDFQIPFINGKELKKLIEELPENMKHVIKKRFFEFKTLEMCADEMRTTRERVKRIEATAVSKSLRLKEKLFAEPILEIQQWEELYGLEETWGILKLYTILKLMPEEIADITGIKLDIVEELLLKYKEVKNQKEKEDKMILADLGLSPKLYDFLTKGRVLSVEQFLKISEKDLQKPWWKHYGDEIRRKREELGEPLK